MPVRFARARLFALAIPAAVLSACGGDSTGGGEKPPPQPTQIVPNTVVNGVITEADPSDLYLPQVPDGATIRLYLRARSGSAADSLLAEVVDRTGFVRAVVRSVGTDAELEGQSTKMMTFVASDSVRVRVRRAGADDGGPYSLRLWVRDPLPEHVSRVLGPGYTVVEGESVDLPDDIDEFRLPSRPGDEILVQLERLAVTGPVGMIVVDSAANQTVRYSMPVDDNAAQSTTQRFHLTGTGPYLVRVGSDDGGRGSYRLHVTPVNRAPETAPATLTLGAVSAQETIGAPGDVDEFTFSGTRGQEVSLLMQLVGGLSAGVQVGLHQGAELLSVAETSTPSATTEDAGIGHVVLPVTGTYTVRVQGSDFAPVAAGTGSYRLELAAVDPRPETAPAALVFGQAVTTERIDRAGDVDEFTLATTPGQLVALSISTPASPAPGFHAQLLDPSGTSTGGAATVASGGSNYLHSGTITIATPGTHRVRVQAEGADRLDRGPYRVEARLVNPAPESRSAVLSPSAQPVTGEALDFPGDVDVFTFQGTPGKVVNVFLRRPERGEGFMSLVVTPPGHPAGEPSPYVAEGWTQGDLRIGKSTGRIVMTAGEYRVTVSGETGSPEGSTQGAYEITLHPLSQAPEQVPAAIAIGDTITGESLDPVGDEDEFTFSAAAGTPLRWFFEYTRPAGFFPLYLFVENAQTGAEVAHSRYVDANQTQHRDFVIPATGTYRVRISGTQWPFPSLESGDPYQRGPYRFAIIRR